MNTFENRLIEHIPKLRRYARALYGNPGSADDLVQDTLERALIKQALWRDDSELRPWLFTLMHNIYINQIRKTCTQPFMQELDENLRDTSETPEARYHAQQLKYNISLLPDDHREVFLLVSLEGFSYVEVADIVGIPVGTVMSRLSRSREKLRNLLDVKKTQSLRSVK